MTTIDFGKWIVDQLDGSLVDIQVPTSTLVRYGRAAWREVQDYYFETYGTNYYNMHVDDESDYQVALTFLGVAIRQRGVPVIYSERADHYVFSRWEERWERYQKQN